MINAITGGTGFIGSLLVDQLLQQGDEVRILTRNSSYTKEGAKVHVGNLCGDSVNLSEFVNDVDVIYHCCGELADKTKMKKLHVEGTRKLLCAAQGKIGKWIQLSSVGVYGRCRSGIITEESPKDPIGEYEGTKAESDQLVASSGIPYAILRPSNVFGNLMPTQSLNQLVRKVQSGAFFYIGKKHAKANYVHVDDVVNAMMLVSKSSKSSGQVFNISQTINIENMVEAIQSNTINPKPFFRLPEVLVRIVAAFFGKLNSFPLTTSRVDAMTGRAVYDSSKIQELIGFEFSDTLEEQLKLFSSQK